MQTSNPLVSATVLMLLISATGCEGFAAFNLQSAAYNQKEVVQTLHDVATISQKSRDYEGAVRYYRSLYQRDPKDPTAALGLIKNMRLLGHLDQAQAIAADALRNNPNSQSIVAELGKLQLAAGRMNAAIKTLTQAVLMAPADWRARSALGIAYDMVGNHTGAQASYGEALKVADGQIALLNNLALSKALEGDLNGAITQLEQVLLRSDISIQITQNLALLHALNGNVEHAQALIRGRLPIDIAENNLNYLAIIGTSIPAQP